MPIQTIYIARHGQTKCNQGDLVQNAKDVLSKQGIMQAKRLGQRAESLEFSTVLCSEFVRAKDTAIAVAESTGKPLCSSSELIEVLHPSEFFGVSRQDPAFLSYIEQKFAAYRNGQADWKFSDEETFTALKERAERALVLFASYGQENVFAVSHGHFLRFLAVFVSLQQHLTPEIWATSYGLAYMKNTGITVFSRDVETNDWKLQIWNDQSHFAEE